MCASCALLHGDTRLSVVIFFVFLFGLFLIIIIILLKLVWFFLPRAIQNVLRAQKKVFGWTGIDIDASGYVSVPILLVEYCSIY